ncbi:MAG: acetyl-CoA carboxylase biotin carboxylase subunit [Eubacteriales bacterium]
MFKKILIANRGEIAVRVIRACRDMGIISVAVYSEADADAMHTQIADEALCIGPASGSKSYLNTDAILTAALLSGAQAIHPGYGFLSENYEFVRRCEENGIVFIGPTAETMIDMGDKSKAKELMKKAGVPVIPGSEGEVKTVGEALECAYAAGYPCMLKSSGGGGGRGIRLVRDDEELRKMFPLCKSEAQTCFGDDRLYLEKAIIDPHHVEIQIMADGHGNTVHLFERDCSLQRRHQKILEESPSPFVTPELRQRMGEAAVKGAKAVGYKGAGTIEFLVDGERNFYFMEMNTRIQVEHPVTETVTGVDLVKCQIEVAAGLPLPFKQEDLRQTGHAIECRINAEDPSRGFAPCPGRIESLNVPGGVGVRVDSAVYQGYSIPPYYDSLIAKLIVYGADRAQAIARTKRALAEYLFEGVSTNTDFHINILSDPDFIEGKYDNNFLTEYLKRTQEKNEK